MYYLIPKNNVFNFDGEKTKIQIDSDTSLYPTLEALKSKAKQEGISLSDYYVSKLETAEPVTVDETTYEALRELASKTDADGYLDNWSGHYVPHMTVSEVYHALKYGFKPKKPTYLVLVPGSFEEQWYYTLDAQGNLAMAHKGDHYLFTLKQIKEFGIQDAPRVSFN